MSRATLIDDYLAGPGALRVVVAGLNREQIVAHPIPGRWSVLTRRQMARILATASDEDFRRTGVHSTDGPLTLETLLRRVTGHIPHHVQFLREKQRALGVD